MICMDRSCQFRKEVYMNELVRLKRRPAYTGNGFYFFLEFKDLDGKRKRISLGHANRRKAERQRTEKEQDLRTGYVQPKAMRLSKFMEDSLFRTGDQIRESTQREYRGSMQDFIRTVGDIDFRVVTVSHCEKYRQACLDRNNSHGTVAKKLRQVKRFHQLAVMRGQLEKNPLAHVKPPRCSKRKVQIYTPEQCQLLLKVAHDRRQPKALNWELLILTALVTGMRRGELLNATWRDVDFANLTMEVNSKKNTDETWEWLIKDSEHRVLPLTDEVVNILAEHQNEQPEGYPYLFVPPWRYERIQKLRRKGRWTYSDSRSKVINNFGRNFGVLLNAAGIEDKTFHDLRRTALTNWLAAGMREHDVMTLAGHSNFATTHGFYLAVNTDLVDRARQAAVKGVCKNLAQMWHKCPSERDIKKGQQAQTLAGQELNEHARQDSNLRPTD